MKLFVGIDISSKDLVTSMISEETTEIVFQAIFSLVVHSFFFILSGQSRKTPLTLNFFYCKIGERNVSNSYFSEKLCRNGIKEGKAK